MGHAGKLILTLLVVGFLKPCEAIGEMKVSCNSDVEGTIYSYGATILDGSKNVSFNEYAGKTVLFVNLATYCGLTMQYLELNALQEEMSQYGFAILGFPSNQFGQLEPGKNEDILQGLKYVKPGKDFVPNFQIFEKGLVNGENEQKVFTFLKSACPPAGDNFGDTKRLFWEPLRLNDIKWNFEKFLVGPDGKPVKRWHPRVSVNVVKKEIQQYLLSQKGNTQ
ncbi:GPX3 peroxidase, partial [Polypterus senegalus]|nr:GPX3 peroxidase [Polypterus senegalus]